MTKPLLADFIENPQASMHDGYYPDFMSCGALAADCFSIASLSYNYELLIDLLRDDVISLPKNTLLLIIYLICSITFPFLFPIYWGVHWCVHKRRYKNMHKRIKAEKEVEQKIVDDFFSQTQRAK